MISSQLWFRFVISDRVDLAESIMRFERVSKKIISFFFSGSHLQNHSTCSQRPRLRECCFQNSCGCSRQLPSEKRMLPCFRWHQRNFRKGFHHDSLSYFIKFYNYFLITSPIYSWNLLNLLLSNLAIVVCFFTIIFAGTGISSRDWEVPGGEGSDWRLSGAGGCQEAGCWGGDAAWSEAGQWGIQKKSRGLALL